MNFLKFAFRSRSYASRIAIITLLFGAVSLFAAPDNDFKIDTGLLKTLTEDESSASPFFVVFGDRPNLAAAARIPNRANRGAAVVSALQTTAYRSQAGVRGVLLGRYVAFKPLWVKNKIYVPARTLELARVLAQR